MNEHAGTPAFARDPGALAEPTDRELLSAEVEAVLAQVTEADPERATAAWAALRARRSTPSRVDELESGFGLSGFERSLLVLTCAPDLSGRAARQLAERTGGPRPTFSLALGALPQAHWDAVTPPSPLRYWGLVGPADPVEPLTSPLRPDESVLHHLVGADAPDEALTLLSQTVDLPTLMPPTFREAARAVVTAWETSAAVVLRGRCAADLRVVAAAGASMAGLVPRQVALRDLPTKGDEISAMLRRMTRQTVLGRWAWLVDASAAVPGHLDTFTRSLPHGDAPMAVLVAGSGGAAATGVGGLPILPVPRLAVGERRACWSVALEQAGAQVSDRERDAVAGSFDLSVPDMMAAARDAATGSSLWAASRRRVRADLGGLASIRVPHADWDCLVLPESATSALRALTASVRHRTRVLDSWGFASRSGGLGTTALFAGPSGTGKTFAAEVIASDLEVDLVHVDLSQVVNKYIGETEKHLAQLFDAAENGGMVLLFDEADALFGKRSEVKDSHDRYANVEVGYLLQRLESFTGLAILTTNARSTLDRAFTRRLASIVTFPYPDAPARERLWAASLPPDMPRVDLDLARLARADLSGGEIAGAALQAAYLAAADDAQVSMEHLAQAIRWELAKSGRTAARERAR